MARDKLPCLVLISGGIDSAACLRYYLHRQHPVAGLFVDYGQPAQHMERRAAVAICERLGIRLGVSQVEGPAVGVGLIRSRNALLLMLALMLTEFDIGLVSMGVHAGTTYPDCSPPFIRHVQSLYDLYTGGRIRVDAPFLEWSKRDVYDFAVGHGVPVDLTYSCLAGAQQPCKICESCRDLEALGVR
jgi:7-cyano-7-deazaguanine synthase